MDNQNAYNKWSENYDTVQNKTRDLEAEAIRSVLAPYTFDHIVELGAGTGKNTIWLSSIAKKITAVDFSTEMLNKAKEKIKNDNITFTEADITKKWDFISSKAGLITSSLILEHIENLDHIFSEAKKILNPGGYFYIGELHPFKQYTGSKARFETEKGLHILDCYTHNISDFTEAAGKNNFTLIQLREWFDDNDTTSIPRLITFLFQI